MPTLWKELPHRQRWKDSEGRDNGIRYFATDAADPIAEAATQGLTARVVWPGETSTYFPLSLSKLYVDHWPDDEYPIVVATYDVRMNTVGWESMLGYLIPSWIEYGERMKEDKASPTPATLGTPFWDTSLTPDAYARWAIIGGMSVIPRGLLVYQLKTLVNASGTTGSPIWIGQKPGDTLDDISAMIGKVNSNACGVKLRSHAAGELLMLRPDTQPLRYGQAIVTLNMAYAGTGLTWPNHVTVKKQILEVREVETVGGATKTIKTWVDAGGAAATRQAFNTASFAAIEDWIK